MAEILTKPMCPKEILTGPYGDLEQMLLTLDPDNLPTSDQLPSRFTSTTTERYANWYSNTVTNIPALRYHELGACVHVRRNPRALIYPIKPEVGTVGVTPLVSRNQEIVYPIAIVHNHDCYQCFSDGDLKTAVNGYFRFGYILNAPVSVLSTTIDNFVLIRTSESTPVYQRSLISGISETDLEPQQENFLTHFRSATELGKLLTEKDFWLLHRKTESSEILAIEEGFAEFHQSFFVSLEIAEKHNMGFYHSRKDGNYHKVSPEGLTSLVEERYEQALRITRQKYWYYFEG